MAMNLFLATIAIAINSCQDELPASPFSSLTAKQEQQMIATGELPEYFQIRLAESQLNGSPPQPSGISVPLELFDRPIHEMPLKQWPTSSATFFHEPARKASGYQAGFGLASKRWPFREPWTDTRFSYSVNQSSVFPLPDAQVYRATLEPTFLRLTNVTKQFPLEQQPRKSSLIITGNCKDTQFYQSLLRTHTWSNYGMIRVYFQILDVDFTQQGNAAAKVTWRRNDDGARQLLLSELREYESQFLMPEKGTTTLRTGDEFSTGYRLFKVLNVVPAGDLPDRGHCEGWVELEEIEHPATDESAAVKDE
jgi:hypothetical protein